MDFLNIDMQLDDDVDDFEVFDLIEFGIPRHIRERSDHFNNFDNLTFFRRFRLTKPTVLDLLVRIEDELEFLNDMNQSVSPINQLLIFLRFCATGNHLSSVGDFAGVHTATVSRIIVRVAEAIARLYEQEIKFPCTAAEITVTQNEFFAIAGFPRVIGTVDCTHIKIQSPGGEDGEIFRNRKSYFSINVQCICNANLEITNIVARWPGSAHDATIFNNSRIRAQFEYNEFGNGVLLGDSGYFLRPYLLTPFLNPSTPAEEQNNRSHIGTRNVIERLFGVLKRRFPVLAYGCRLKLETTLTVIVATAVLHNIARRRGEEEPPIQPRHEHLEDVIINGQIAPDINNLHNNNDQNVRQHLVNFYFDNV